MHVLIAITHTFTEIGQVSFLHVLLMLDND